MRIRVVKSYEGFFEANEVGEVFDVPDDFGLFLIQQDIVIEDKMITKMEVK
jgi:hypothetical protein